MTHRMTEPDGAERPDAPHVGVKDEVETDAEFIDRMAGDGWSNRRLGDRDRLVSLARQALSAADARIELLEAVLEDSYRQFNFYASEHERAGKTAKAKTNRDFANQIKAALVADPAPARAENRS